MTNQTTKTFVVAISMSSLCFSSVSLGKANNNDQSISGKRPLLTPMAHTNQDDEAKRFHLPDFDGKHPDGLGIHSTVDVRPTDLVEIAIVSSTSDLNSEQLDRIRGEFRLQITVDSDFDPGFVSDFTDLETWNADLIEIQPEISNLNVPAPGVLTLLALAGLSRGRRKR